MPDFWEFERKDEVLQRRIDDALKKYDTPAPQIPNVQEPQAPTPAPQGGGMERIDEALRKYSTPQATGGAPALPTIGGVAKGAWDVFSGVLGAGTKYVAKPVLGAITAGLTPGQQVELDPSQAVWQQLQSAYKQWTPIEEARKPLFPGEKFLTENIIFDPITWIGAGFLGIPGAGARLVAKGGKAATIGKGLMAAEKVVEWPGKQVLKGVGAVASPVVKGADKLLSKAGDETSGLLASLKKANWGDLAQGQRGSWAPFAKMGKNTDMVPIEKIKIEPGFFQARQGVDPATGTFAARVKELVEGFDPKQLENIVVWKRGDELVLLSGHHRLAAFKELAKVGKGELPAGFFKQIPADIIEGVSKDEAATLAFLSNMNTKQYSAQEIATRIKAWADGGKTSKEIAKLTNITEPTVERYLSIAALPVEVQAQAGTGVLTIEKAVAMGRLAREHNIDPAQMQMLWREHFSAPDVTADGVRAFAARYLEIAEKLKQTDMFSDTALFGAQKANLLEAETMVAQEIANLMKAKTRLAAVLKEGTQLQKADPEWTAYESATRKMVKAVEARIARLKENPTEVLLTRQAAITEAPDAAQKALAQAPVEKAIPEAARAMTPPAPVAPRAVTPEAPIAPQAPIAPERMAQGGLPIAPKEAVIPTKPVGPTAGPPSPAAPQPPPVGRPALVGGTGAGTPQPRVDPMSQAPVGVPGYTPAEPILRGGATQGATEAPLGATAQGTPFSGRPSGAAQETFMPPSGVGDVSPQQVQKMVQQGFIPTMVDGRTLPDMTPRLRPTNEVLETAYQPDGWRKITTWAENNESNVLARVLKPVMHEGVGIPADDIATRAIVLHEWDLSTINSGSAVAKAYMKQFGSSVELLGAVAKKSSKGVPYFEVSFGGFTRPLNDFISEVPENILNSMSAKQQEFIRAVRQMHPMIADFVTGHGVELTPEVMELGKSHVGRKIIAQWADGKQVTASAIAKARGGMPTLNAKAGFQKPKTYLTEAAAIADGFQSALPEDTLISNWDDAARLVADKRTTDYLVEALNAAGTKAGGKTFTEAAIPGIPGKVFKAEDVAPFIEHITQRGQQAGILDKLVGDANSIARQMMTTADLGGSFIQGQLLMATRPGDWARALGLGLRSFADPQATAKFSVEHAPTLLEMAKHGVKMTTSEFGEATYRLADKKGLAKVLKGVLDPFQRLFESNLLAAKVYGWEATRHLAKTDADLADLARFWTYATGTLDMGRLGFSKAHQVGEAAALFAPAYNRAAIAVLFDIFQGGLRGKLARDAIGKWMLSATLGYSAICAAMGQKPNLDPRDRGKWLTVRVGDQNVGIGGAYYIMFRALGQMIASPEKAPEIIGQFIKGKASPVVSAGMQIISRQDSLGRTFDNPLQLTADIVKNNMVPLWLQGTLEAGNDWKEKLAVGGLEFAGLRTFPTSPAAKRGELQDQYAQQTYGKAWDALSRVERLELQNRNPDLAQATRAAQEMAQKRGDKVSLFWAEVEEMREQGQAQIQALNQKLHAGEITGRDYREQIIALERQNAKIPSLLQATGRYAGVPITRAERAAYYAQRGIQAQDSTTPVDEYIDEYYDIAQRLTDRQTGEADAEGIVLARAALEKKYPADVVKQGKAYINRNRDPLYVQAVEEYRQYASIPKYLGLSPEEERKAANAIRKIASLRRLNPEVSTDLTRAMYAMQDPEGAALAKIAPKLVNPARKQFWAMHPLLSVFFGDLTLEEAEAYPFATGGLSNVGNAFAGAATSGTGANPFGQFLASGGF